MPIIRNYRTISGEQVPPLPPQPRVPSPLDDLEGRAQFIPKNANKYRPKLLLQWFKTDLDRGFKVEVNQPAPAGSWFKTQLDIEDDIAPYKPSPFEKWKTDLTYLKFGQDQPGGGSSKQPYISFPIPNPKLPRLNPSLAGLRTNQYVTGRVLLGQNEPTSPEIAQYYLSNRTNGDFPARGGGVSYQIGSQTYTLSSQIDRDRIANFLSDRGRGDVFVRKQQGLQLSNPQMESGKSISNVGQFSPLPSILENTRTYSANNTLFQVGVAGTGFHALRMGNSPLDSGNNFYAGTVGRQSLLDSQQVQGQNRLLVLTNMKLTGGAGFSSMPGTLNSTSNTIRAANTIVNSGISLNNQAVMDYAGGPGSAYGIGTTTIRRSSNTAEAGEQLKNTQQQRAMSGARVKNYEDLASQNLNNTTEGKRTTNIQDSSGNKIKSREEVYKLTVKTDISYANDFIVHNQENVSGDPWPSAEPDMIKLGFECIDNDNPDNATFLQFRAYLTNGLSDSNSANYNTFKYLGRGEDFYVYQGFSRTISFGFRIVAFGWIEHEAAFKKLNTLMSQVYPDYSPTTKIMRAPLTRLTIGDYIYRMPGVIDSINVTVDQESSWSPSNQDLEPLELPYYVNVEVVFKPIMEMLPQRTLANKPGGGLILNGVINPPIAAAAAAQAQAEAEAQAALDAQVSSAIAAAAANAMQNANNIAGPSAAPASTQTTVKPTAQAPVTRKTTTASTAPKTVQKPAVNTVPLYGTTEGKNVINAATLNNISVMPRNPSTATNFSMLQYQGGVRTSNTLPTNPNNLPAINPLAGFGR